MNRAFSPSSQPAARHPGRPSVHAHAVRRGLVRALAALGVLAAVAASLPDTALVGAARADERLQNLRIATVQNTDHPFVMGAQRLADQIAERSGGALKAKVYPGGTLGGDAQVISSLQGGTVDMTVVSTGLLAQLSKNFGMFYLPMVFDTGEQADAVVDGPVGQQLLDTLPPKGLVGLAYWEHGFRSVTNSRRPITRLEDMNGLKFRVIQVPIIIDIYNALGTNAVPMPFPELYTALEQKAVDGQENALATIETAKLAEVQKYLSLTKIVYDPLVVLFSKKTWDRMTPQQQTMVREAARDATLYQRRLNREHEHAIIDGKAEQTRGMQVNELSPAERQRLRDALKAVNDKHEKQYDAPVLKAFLDAAKAAH